MKKRITVLVLSEELGPLFEEELLQVFGDILEIEYLSPSQARNINNTDLILCHDPGILAQMVQYIRCDAPVLVMKRTITKKALEQIQSLPPGKKALIVGFNDYSAIEIVMTIYQLGVHHLVLYPFYLGMQDIPAVDYVIAPRHYKHTPTEAGQLILIDRRIFSIDNILDISTALNLEKETANKIVATHMLKTPTFWQGIRNVLHDRRVLQTAWNIVLNEVDSATVVCDSNGEILFMNSKALQVLGVQSGDFEGKNLVNLVGENASLQFLLTDKPRNHELINHNGAQWVTTVRKIEFDNKIYGRVIMISLYKEMLKVQQQIHRKIIGKGYFTKYSFDHIMGSNPKLLETIELCKRLAQSSSTIMLTGESGTGKEMFAGAIHNYSARRQKPFVAINCAAIPENLLESELFGYEEGAFTGAKKGGKMGVFEMAHQGTLFLDEIGEMPLQIQARLLRVLQEKAVIRLGGDTVTHIDVRIITATNRDLWKMVQEGSFRKDLFFRINVFQVAIPALRERISDVPILISHFMGELGVNRHVSQDFADFCRHYDWPGNVRELRNLLEFMLTVSDGDLSVAYLPHYLKHRYCHNPGNGTSEVGSEELLLLKLLFAEQGKGHNTGRRSLYHAFNTTYYKISEATIRKMLDSLVQKGYVNISLGRSGCRLTKSGEELCREA